MTEPRAADQAFNITNGDMFRWSRLWPQLAEYFGVRCGIVRPLRLERWMADKAPVWRRIAERHNLRYPDIADVALWPYGDFVWNIDWDVVSSMNRARAAGFTELRRYHGAVHRPPERLPWPEHPALSQTETSA